MITRLNFARLPLAVVFGGLYVMLIVSLTTGLGLGLCRYDIRSVWIRDFILILSPLLYGGLGIAVIAVERRNAIGWVMLMAGAGFGTAQFLNLYTSCLVEGVALPAPAFSFWLMYSLLPILGFPIMLIFYLLPDGRFLSRYWRGATIIAGAIVIVTQLLLAFLPGAMQHNRYGYATTLENPFGMWWLPSFPGPAAAWISWMTLNVFFLLGVLAFILRFRRATGDARQQLKWIAYLLAVAGTTQMTFELLGVFVTPEVFDLWVYRLSGVALFVGLPLVIGIAVFKYRLYDIDLIIKRTLLYGLLTALLAVVYFGSVIVSQRITTQIVGHGSDLAIVLSTLVIAVLFNPLRLRLQSWIDRRFYRRRYDATQALQTFAATARNEVDVDELEQELIALIQRTVQPSHVAVWTRKPAE
jgi:hypothetical protein